MLQLVRYLMSIARTLKCVIYDFIPFYSTIFALQCITLALQCIVFVYIKKTKDYGNKIIENFNFFQIAG